MMKFLIALTVLILFIGSLPEQGFAQSTAGRWSMGFHGGLNLWLNDMNIRKVGEGGEMYIRYGVSPHFSLGLQGGYEEPKSFQSPVFPLELPNEYLKLRAGNANFVGWIHLAPGKSFAPYLYLGAGVMFYKRVNGLGLNYPNTKIATSIHLPVGFGFEAFLGKDISLTMEASARVLDDHTDFYKFKSPDWYGSVKAGVNFYFGTSSLDDDDEDGLTNVQEAILGTDPSSPDTDRDGLKDGEEFRRYKTDPLKPDSDGDTVNDGDEIIKYHTDPNQADTDGDGLTDGVEINKYGTDPLKIDTDGDTLTDGDEVLKYNTDPLKADTDGDGLSDWDEVRSYKSDPNKTDTDGDGLTDGDEVRKYKTDPTKSDSDGGGITDGAETIKGTNPLDQRDDLSAGQLILQPGKAVVLEGVNFVSGSAKLLQHSENTLGRALAALSGNPDLRVEIVGYTDNRGSAESNTALSLKRAQAVKAWLVRRGIDASQLSVRGKGMNEPIDTNDTSDGRANNRRIEFHVLK